MLSMPVCFCAIRESILIQFRFIQLRELFTLYPHRPLLVPKGVVRKPRIVQGARVPECLSETIADNVQLAPSV
jgi:hypothetical protein